MAGYLLGEMSDDEQAQFETRYLANDALFEQMLLVKEELIDAYVRNHLDAGTREKFERHFLASPEGQKEVAFARGLREKLSEPQLTPLAKTQTARWSARFASLPIREIGLAAAALLLLMIGLGWLWKENQKLRRELSALHSEQEQRLQHERKLEQQLAELRAQQPSASPTPLPPDRPAQTTDLFAINLSPEARAGSSDVQVIKLATTIARFPRLNLQLNFEPVAMRCSVVLQTPDGTKIERRNLRARPHPQGGFTVQADFITTRLKAGTYEAIVTGRDAEDNEQQAIAYRFRIEVAGQQ